MKIYFAYRTGYTPNHRLVKIMEANSILDWFQQNWENLCHDEKKVLDFNVYGFPILRLEEVESIPPPKNLKELKEILLENLYLNNLFVTKEYIIGFTDDDEIELAWAIFTEDYAQKYPEITSIWLQDVLPTNFSQEPNTEVVKGIKVKAKGLESCNTYYLSTVIYDGSHSEDLSKPVIIEGVSLPNLVDFFKQNELLKLSSDIPYKKTELLFLQYVAQSFLPTDLPSFVEKISKYNFEGILGKIDFKATSQISVEELTTYQNPNPNSKYNISEHIVEIYTYWIGFYDYVVLFDDYWYNQHPTLAKSLINFHEKAILYKKMQYQFS